MTNHVLDDITIIIDQSHVRWHHQWTITYQNAWGICSGWIRGSEISMIDKVSHYVLSYLSLYTCINSLCFPPNIENTNHDFISKVFKQPFKEILGQFSFTEAHLKIANLKEGGIFADHISWANHSPLWQGFVKDGFNTVVIYRRKSLLRFTCLILKSLWYFFLLIDSTRLSHHETDPALPPFIMLLNGDTMELQQRWLLVLSVGVLSAPIIAQQLLQLDANKSGVTLGET